MTSFGDKWLGDESLVPVMEELNRRRAIVYTHPTVANCCRNVLPDVHYSVVELSTDTTRAIANVIFSGAAARFPDIRFIFSHAGGTMPFIYQRFVAYPLLDKALGLNKAIQDKVPAGVLKILQSLLRYRAGGAPDGHEALGEPRIAEANPLWHRFSLQNRCRPYQGFGGLRVRCGRSRADISQ